LRRRLLSTTQQRYGRARGLYPGAVGPGTGYTLDEAGQVVEDGQQYPAREFRGAAELQWSG